VRRKDNDVAWTLDFAYDPREPHPTDHGSIYATDPTTGRQILWRGVGHGYVAEPDGEGMAIRDAVTMAGSLAQVFASADRVCERRTMERVS
jgi:hypothetical protein